MPRNNRRDSCRNCRATHPTPPSIHDDPTDPLPAMAPAQCRTVLWVHRCDKATVQHVKLTRPLPRLLGSEPIPLTAEGTANLDSGNRDSTRRRTILRRRHVNCFNHHANRGLELGLSSWIRQKLFAAFYQALARLLAAENVAHLASMQAAENNIEQRLDELTAHYHRRRQNAITAGVARRNGRIRDSQTVGNEIHLNPAITPRIKVD